MLSVWRGRSTSVRRSVVRGMRFLQVVPQMHIQGDRDAHYDQRAPPRIRNHQIIRTAD